ncbi:MAG: cyanophycinase [Bryobacteraceae bacterium]
MSRLLIVVLGTAVLFAAQPPSSSGPGWIYWRTGNVTDVQKSTAGGFVFEGGSTDVDAAYQWMCKKANGGDFLVIRSSGSSDYNPYIYGLCPGINSVSTLKILSRDGAQQPFVAETIRKAEVLFIAGGDQANYVNHWLGTPVHDAIDELAARGTPIGGTSAGDAILAEFSFSALHDTITSPQALANPFDDRVTLTNGFLRLNASLSRRITDTHFAARDRMGRLLVFLARMAQTGEAAAIATDEKTALLMEPDGRATVVGKGAVYFVQAPGKPEVCRPGTPLTYLNLSVYKIRQGAAFNVRTWSGTGGTAYSLSVQEGVVSSTQPGGAIY